MKKVKLIKTFTRDFSLFISQWFKEALGKNFKREFGVCYQDAPAINNGLAVTYFYREDDLLAVKKGVLKKIKSNPKYYSKASKRYRRLINEIKKELVGVKRKEALDKEMVSLFRHLFFRLYPMLRICNFLPSFWADDLKSGLGGKAEEVISLAYQDRLFSEGMFEKIDSEIQRLIKRNLSRLQKPQSWSKFLSARELNQLAEKRKINWDAIKERSKGYVYCQDKIFPSVNYAKILSFCGYILEEEKTEVNLIKGQVACRGKKVGGEVKLIFSLEQIREFKKGKILVTPMTVPDFMPAIRKAKAIVTDEGGITCHAAIVSRELGIPCVIGTKVATKVLKDGDWVEVDAEKGVVKKI